MIREQQQQRQQRVTRRLRQRTRELERQRRIFIAIAITFSLVILSIITASTIQGRKNNYNYTTTATYYVSKGETLWTIAQQFSDNRHDIRKVIYEIEQLSNCNADLQVGQQLTIPLYNVMNTIE